MHRGKKRVIIFLKKGLTWISAKLVGLDDLEGISAEKGFSI